MPIFHPCNPTQAHIFQRNSQSQLWTTLHVTEKHVGKNLADHISANYVSTGACHAQQGSDTSPNYQLMQGKETLSVTLGNQETLSVPVAGGGVCAHNTSPFPCICPLEITCLASYLGQPAPVSVRCAIHQHRYLKLLANPTPNGIGRL